MQPQNWIKSRLKKRGHKLKDLAISLKTTPPRITDVITGKREVQSNEVLKLSEYLGLSLEHLLLSLDQGQLVQPPDHEKSETLAILGSVTGQGSLLPLPQSFSPRQVAVPIDAETARGLTAYRMGDNSLSQEISEGSIIIAADPRIHFYPMIPGSLLVFRRDTKQEHLYIRQYHKTAAGENWLISLPDKPNPDYASFRFNLSQSDARLDCENDKEIQHFDTVNTQDIEAVVLWVQKIYK